MYIYAIEITRSLMYISTHTRASILPYIYVNTSFINVGITRCIAHISLNPTLQINARQTKHLAQNCVACARGQKH